MKRTKTGGRKVGVANKRTLAALEVFGDFCPLEGILNKLSAENIEAELYIHTCLKLMKFKFPERKAVEHTFDPKTANDDELIATTLQLLEEIKRSGHEEEHES